MVLDWLVDVHKAEEQPARMLVLGFIYSSIAAAVSLLIFPKNAAPIMLVLTVLAFTPLMIRLMKAEEIKDECARSSLKILTKEHWPALKFFIFMFVGMFLAYAAWFAFLPSGLIESLFSTQIETISGRVTDFGALTSTSNVFMAIFANNMKVLAVSIFLSFVFGAGAIFILTWNATILGALFGNAFRHTIDFSVSKYLIHGIPEITAYFMAGLAGGIISIGVARHKLGTKEFNKILLDSGELILLSVVTLVIAGILEVSVSPLIG